jgi:hypothetical protein
MKRSSSAMWPRSFAWIEPSRMRRCASSARSRAASWSEKIWVRKSQALRTWSGTRRGALLWQEISPQSSPSRRIEIDMEAMVPMLRMYSRWTGETLRRTA